MNDNFYYSRLTYAAASIVNSAYGIQFDSGHFDPLTSKLDFNSHDLWFDTDYDWIMGIFLD
jgi:hypothetical protein